MTQPIPQPPLGPVSTPGFRAGRTLADAITLLGRRFGAFALLQLLPFAVVVGVALLISAVVPDAFEAERTPGEVVGLAVFLVAFYLLPSCGMVAIGTGCYRELRGERASLGELLALLVTRLHVVLGVLVFTFLLLVGVSVFVGLIAMIPILGPIVGAVVTVYFALSLFLIFPAVGVERLGPIGSMKRSFELVTNNRLRLLGALLLLIMISVGLWLAWFFGFGYHELASADELETELTRTSAIVMVAIVFVVSLLGSCLAGSAYYHLRRAAGEDEAEDVAAVFD